MIERPSVGAGEVFALAGARASTFEVGRQIHDKFDQSRASALTGERHSRDKTAPAQQWRLFMRSRRSAGR